MVFHETLLIILCGFKTKFKKKKLFVTMVDLENKTRPSLQKIEILAVTYVDAKDPYSLQ